MPTQLPRTMITRTPRVERLIAYGQTKWPDKSPGAILVALAEQAVNDQPRHAELRMFPADRVITTAMVEEALDDV